MAARLDLTREQILSFRRAATSLDERLPPGATSLRRAAWAGLQDSMPRAAVLSIHARVQGTGPDTWEDQSLVQLWGPRLSAYVVAARDLAVFSLGRLPIAATRRRAAEELANRLETFLDGRRMPFGEAGHGLGLSPNKLRYAAPTGRVLIRWDGARQPTVWTVPPPDTDPRDARLELARRYLHVFGPTTSVAFAQWAGIGPAESRAAFDALAGSLAPVRTPVGDAWILTRDEPAFRAHRSGGAGAVAAERRRVLPPGRSRPGDPGPRPRPPARALDHSSLARRRPGGRRHRRDMETDQGRPLDLPMASADTFAAPSRGGRGRVHAATGHRPVGPGPVER